MANAAWFAMRITSVGKIGTNNSYCFRLTVGIIHASTLVFTWLCLKPYIHF